MGRMADTIEAKAIDIVQIPRCGFGMRTRWNLSSGDVLLREQPLAALRSSALHALCSEPEPHPAQQPHPSCSGSSSPWSDSQWWPTADPAPTELIERFASREFAKLPEHLQHRWMALADAFSSPPAKSPGERHTPPLAVASCHSGARHPCVSATTGPKGLDPTLPLASPSARCEDT